MQTVGGSRFCQPFGDSFQNLYIAHVGIIKAGGIEEDQTVVLEVWEMRNGDDICRGRFSSTRTRVIADFHLFCPDDRVNELQARSVSDMVSVKPNLAYRTLPRASWTQNTTVNVSYRLLRTMNE